MGGAHRILGTVALALLGAAPAAEAARWSQGEGVGRAGIQALGGRPPLEPLYRLDLPRGARLATPLLITNGGAGRGDVPAPRLAFGTEDGVVHLFDLHTGARVGDPLGVHVAGSRRPYAFSGFGGSIGLLDTSTEEEGLGQLFVVHNDEDQGNPFDQSPTPEFTDDVGIAQIDQETGRLVVDVNVPGTDEYRVSGTPALSEPDEGGRRHLIIGMVDDEDWEQEYGEPDPGASDPLGLGGEPDDPKAAPKVVRVGIDRGRSVDAFIDGGGAQEAEMAFLDPLAPLSIAHFTGEHVLVPTADPAAPLKTLPVDDVAGAGPASPQLDADASDKDLVIAQAVAAPVTPQGRPPGVPSSNLPRAQVLYMATYRPKLDRTIVHRLVPDAEGTALVESARSQSFKGRPAVQLATTAFAGPPGTPQGLVVLATEHNLYALRGGDLQLRWRLDARDGLQRGSSGFTRTAPAAVPGAVLAIRDSGEPLVLDPATGRPVDGAAFQPFAEHAGSVLAAPGSPAVANGVVVFASDRGVFAYRNACGNPRAGSEFSEALVGTPAGDDVKALGGNDTVTLRDGDDCVALGAGDDVADLGSGADTATGDVGADRVLAGPGADNVDGGDGADVLDGGDAVDLLRGGTGNDLAKGGNGNDRMEGGDGDDTLSGDGDHDVLRGGLGRDRLKGRIGDDRLFGGAHGDALDGGPGHDRLHPGPGADRVSGGQGDDRVAAADGVADVIACGEGEDRVVADRRDRVAADCERVVRRTRGRR